MYQIMILVEGSWQYVGHKMTKPDANYWTTRIWQLLPNAKIRVVKA